MSISSVVAMLRKKCNDNVFIASDLAGALEIKQSCTGNAQLDFLTRGGIPLGRITEIMGPESSYKSTIALLAAKNFLASPVFKGKKAENVYVVYVDLEGTFTFKYAADLGLDIDRLIRVMPEKGEQVFDRVYDLVTNDDNDRILVIIDSLAELSPSGDLDKEIEDYELMAGQARLITSGYRRKLIPLLRRYWKLIDSPKVTIVTINQARDKFSTFSRFKDIQGPGGHSRLHHNSLFIQLTRSQTLKQTIQRRGVKMVLPRGDEISMVIRKSKIGIPWPTSGKTIHYNETYDDDGFPRVAGEFNNIDVAFNYGNFLGLIDQEKRTYSHKGVKLGIGEKAARVFLYENPPKYLRLFSDIIQELRKQDAQTSAPQDFERVSDAEFDEDDIFTRFGESDAGRESGDGDAEDSATAIARPRAGFAARS